jgi:ferredoxin-NADP reductase
MRYLFTLLSTVWWAFLPQLVAWRRLTARFCVSNADVYAFLTWVDDLVAQHLQLQHLYCYAEQGEPAD